MRSASASRHACVSGPVPYPFGAPIDHRSEFASGGHFPAMEVPDLTVADLPAFLRTVRA